MGAHMFLFEILRGIKERFQLSHDVALVLFRDDRDGDERAFADGSVTEIAFGGDRRPRSIDQALPRQAGQPVQISRVVRYILIEKS
jgi:hypothetical protein